MMVRRGLAAGLIAGVVTLAPRVADAFCGFYVANGDAKLYNNATVVVLMRDGTRTVLSMQNNYQGPPQDFAMVVPVPVILKEKDVKTLPREIFERVDRLAAPRLVEYWEQNPCRGEIRYKRTMPLAGDKESGARRRALDQEHSVKVEAEFAVGEYKVQILRAQEATGLEAWLRANKYAIPEGAADVLRPYVQGGMRFFVAKVDVKKVKFDDGGQAMLSPLRFHYDSETFNLPVRLGLLNSAGAQDLIVHILARSRYEVANYPNVTIPTNIDVKERVRGAFGQFYVSLFDTTLGQNPRAVITEYAWQASSCDPCPGEPLDVADILTLGADTLSLNDPTAWDRDIGYRWTLPSLFVLTRLHARYGKDSLGEDLVFREASPIGGGREGQDQGAAPDSENAFQARYAIRHAWDGEIACAKPVRGRWGGRVQGAKPPIKAAQELAFVDRTWALGESVAQSVPALKLVVNSPAPVPASSPEIVPDAGAGTNAPEPAAPVEPTALPPGGRTGRGCREDADGAGWLAPLVLLAWRRRNGG